MFLVSLVLPVLALCLIAYFFCYPLPVLFGMVKYTQTSDPSPDQVQAIANKRGQDDEYETLLALGFKPLGTQHESYGFLSSKQPTLIFVHEQLPVFAHLLANVDKQLFLKMVTTGQGDCVLETSSSPASIVVNEPTFRVIRLDAFNTEDVFCSHIKSLSQWELEGFKPVSASSLVDVEDQNDIIMKKGPIKKLVRIASILIALASLVATVVLPVLFGAFTVSICIICFKVSPTPMLVLNVISGWVLFASFHFYRGVVKPRRNVTRNSLGNRSAILTTKRVDIKKVVDGGETRFELPYRNDPGQRLYALPNIYAPIVGTFMVGYVYFKVAELWVIPFVPVIAFSLLLYAIILISGPAWRVLLGKSIHELSIKDGKLHSRERKFILHSDQQCSVDKILAIHIEPIAKYLDFSPYFNFDADPDWGVLVVKRTPEDQRHDRYASANTLLIKWMNKLKKRGALDRARDDRPLCIAACYRLDLLTSLAHELAYETGLSADQIIVSEDVLKGIDSVEVNRDFDHWPRLTPEKLTSNSD